MKLRTLALAAMAAIPSGGHAQPSARCDRACLIGIADGYVAALVAHDPKQAKLASDLVTVENLARIQPGEGLWKSLSGGPTAFRIVVPDTVSQQVAYLAVLQESGKPIELGIRLRVQNGKVVEAEHLVVHELRETSMKNLQKPRAAFSRAVPESYRAGRGLLLTIGAAYYDALDNNNGSLGYFADDCVRHENGMQTDRNPVPDDPQAVASPIGYLGSLGCAAQIDSGAFQYITTIENRRVWIADEETGLVVGFSHFHHAFTQHEFPVYGVPWMQTNKMDYKPFDLPAMHIFKVWGGKVHEVEAIGYTTAYQSPSGWEK